jgi:glycosyltransferase involved in cell wall biosynthesis
MARTGRSVVRDLADTASLARLLRHLRPDVTLGYFIKPVIFGTLAAWMARVPRRIAMIEGLGYVFTEGARASVSKRILKSVVSSLYRFALARAHRVIFLNKDDASDFVAARLVDSVKVFQLGAIGVDLQSWQQSPQHSDPITFALATRLIRAKGVVEYAEAARIVKAEFPHVRFILLGGLDENPDALKRAEIESWVREGLLEWPGHVDVRKWLLKTSVYVLPSFYREGVPRSTQEAMAMGRAVITTDSPGCRDTVVHDLNGFLVPVRNVAALAAAMKRFIAQPELIATMGAASRRLAEAYFDMHVANQKLIRVFEGE